MTNSFVNPMSKRPLRGIGGAILICTFGALLTACGGDDDRLARYEVTITNLTAAQPLSPAAVVLHNSNWSSMSLGTPASESLEILAEGGDNSGYLADAESDRHVRATSAGTGVILPGGSETLMLETKSRRLESLLLSATVMLVNTNDAIAAVLDQSLADLEAGESVMFTAISYDTGTEANSETADTIPGPAASTGAQEGFNAVRDDLRDAVHVHPGVVTSDDGLSTSVLTADHRWDNPVMSVVVERTQ